MRSSKIFIVLIILLVFTVLLFYYKPFSSLAESESEEQDSLIICNLKREYGIPIDSFIVHRGYIRPGQSLSTLLSPFGISPLIIEKIANCPDTLFNARRIKAGNFFAIYSTLDSIPVPKYFVYEHSITDYFLIDLLDSIRIEKGQKEISKLNRKVSGEVKSSLWNAMTTVGVSPVLALNLSDIYAWSIDFFGIQKGDSFKVCFSEHYVDTLYAGIGKINAAWFKTGDKEYYAIPFVQDSIESYYNEQGENLKKAFLKAPLNYTRISSRFSNSRMHPVLKYRRAHHGVDYAAPTGTPVYTIGDGVVEFIGWAGGGGKTVKIKHNSVYTTSYMHLSNYAKGLKKGQRVSQGQLIGYVGSTGLATGPHLDFRFYKNGKAIDPLKVEAPPAEPVSPENMILFKQKADSLIKILKAI